MARIKRAALSRVRKNVLFKRVKGFFLGRQRLRQAMEHLDRARRFAFAGRKQKKRNYRGIWIVRINAALAPYNMSYSRFIHALKQADIQLDRKILADLALNDPAAFKAVVDRVRG
ncbi:MAG TPA: 50S ribosomal protein L20 [Myxococcota bacterium]|jgi:large subunit ribosomal protein L20|nr:50S ribosomal protein L20 [Myxococcota bacterium]